MLVLQADPQEERKGDRMKTYKLIQNGREVEQAKTKSEALIKANCLYNKVLKATGQRARVRIVEQ